MSPEIRALGPSAKSHGSGLFELVFCCGSTEEFNKPKRGTEINTQVPGTRENKGGGYASHHGVTTAGSRKRTSTQEGRKTGSTGIFGFVYCLFTFSVLLTDLTIRLKWKSFATARHPQSSMRKVMSREARELPPACNWRGCLMKGGGYLRPRRVGKIHTLPVELWSTAMQETTQRRTEIR